MTTTVPEAPDISTPAKVQAAQRKFLRTVAALAQTLPPPKSLSVSVGSSGRMTGSLSFDTIADVEAWAGQLGTTIADRFPMDDGTRTVVTAYGYLAGIHVQIIGSEPTGGVS